ncbi:MAG: MFS transporter [Thermogemmata sp.]|uniref:MFS transporter n=1 Tax=Thermogemmata fonticola TaxID=2755323 RepID=A0A7V8VAW6_9BACT|nr:MFS transporter [Thermogemmata fonticola]MBA2224657.1 MFS transporter [Thermogemmata fonticola]MCX8138563.1 MFS transporter [Gemmataceae bacterium]
MTAPESSLRSPWRWWVCLLLMLATIINYMDRLALNQLALRIKIYFDLSHQQYSFLESAFSLAFALGAVMTGILVDRISVRWVYPIMVLGWSLAGVLTGFAVHFWMLLACRFALGLFEAGNWPCGIRTTRAVLPPEERSLGNSIFQSGTALGAVITPLTVLALLRSADPQEGFRHAVIAVTGGTYAAVSQAPADAWKYPFRVIGSLGVVWIVLWFVTVPRRWLHTPQRTQLPTAPPPPPFRLILADRRFWVLLVLVVAINVAWHGYRAWLPLYLQEQRNYSEVGMSQLTTAYYLVADIGAWTLGGLTLVLCRWGMPVSQARIVALGLASIATLATLLIPWLPEGTPLLVGLLLVAFGAMGAFPTYFALSQDLSLQHQGKVSGFLGASAHVSLALIYPLEGWIIAWTDSYESVLAVIGLAPALAWLIVWWYWPREQRS